MNKLSVYFAMNGNTCEAMDFYQSCFGGGEPTLTIIGESPMKEHFPASMQDKILHAELIMDDFRLMASDMNGPDGYVAGNNITVSLDYPEDDTAKNRFTKLAAGGTIMKEYQPQFWGGNMGVLTDKFGIKWMITYSV